MLPNPMRALTLLLAVLVLLAPIAAAHGALNARELEVLVLQDELSDTQTELAGYDLGQFFVAEAWVPNYGDGLYFHTALFGSFPGKPPARELKVVFTIVDDKGTSIKRSVATKDGKSFQTDFDHLEVEPGADQVEIERAFIAYEGSGLGPGAVIKTFLVESFADGEIRDRAPGPLYAPGSGGRVEIPGGTSRQVVPSLALTGPIGYAKAAFTAVGADEYEVKIESLLTKGAQHVHLELPEWSSEDPMITGWDIRFLGANGGEVPAKGSLVVRFFLAPVPAENGLLVPQMINITTDIGGRLGYQLRLTPTGTAFVPESEIQDWAPMRAHTGSSDAPSVGLLAGVIALACAIGLARRRM